MKDEIHEGWTIEEGPYKGEWNFGHSEYDADCIDGEMVGNGLSGFGTSKEDCINQIQEIEMDPDYSEIFGISPCCEDEVL
jgi:hypothetical protein